MTAAKGPSSPLQALHAARGARFRQVHGHRVPAVFSSVHAEYQALQEGAGLLDICWRSRLRISGRDRKRWLQGQVTQDVAALQAGEGTYSAVLTPQGRMVAEVHIYDLGDVLFLEAPSLQPSLSEHLDRYLIMERAEIEDISTGWAQLSVQGPMSVCALAGVLPARLADLPPLGVVQANFDGRQALVARVPRCGEDGFDVYVPAADAAALWSALCQHRGEVAVHSVGWDALNVRRVEAGIPWWGSELDSTIVPLEARLDHAISRTKGCYVGQEIIARIDARGHVNNLLAGFFVEGETLPPTGAEIRRNGARVGRVTSAVHSCKLERPIALGFLRRELQEPGTRLEAFAPDHPPTPLVVTQLPFVPHDFPPQAPVPCS